MRDAHRAPARGAGRRGFALLAVLWVMVGVAALALGGTLAGRESVDTARNRVSLARASWRAEGCVERARAAVADTLAARAGAERGWMALDSIIAASPLTQGCDLIVRPAGIALDVNAATDDQLRALVAAIGLTVEQADSLSDAILDWRDADAAPRPRGAEGDWYRARRRLAPRDGPFAARAEITLVRGVAGVPGLDALLDVDSARLVKGRAPPVVLAAVLGSPAAAGSPQAPPLMDRVTDAPDAWIVTGRARSGEPAVEAAVEVRLVRAATHAAVVRRRSWP